jgi:hypothetical protein
MAEVFETPTDDFGGLSLYQTDIKMEEFPDHISVGSSISQSKKTTVEIDADLFRDAVTGFAEMRAEVYNYIHSFG